MREQRLLHARHEHAIELQALRGVHRHHGDRLAVLVHGVEVGTQAHPLQEVGQRIAAQHAHGLGGTFAFPALLAYRGCRVIGIFLLVGVHELVDYGQELLDVLHAPARLIAVLGLQGADQAGLVDDGLDALAQVARVGLRVLDDLHELPHAAARGGAQLGVGDGDLGALHERHVHLARELLDALHRGLADAAARRVDDALGRDVVGGVDHQRKVGHDVADLGAVEESRAADDAVRNAGAQQHIFKHARLGVGAVKHRHLVVGQPLLALLLDLAGDPAALVTLVGGHVHVDLLAVLLVGEQLLHLAMLVVRDDGVGRGQNVAHAAVVLFQLHRGALRIVLLELQDVADIGAAPAVNGLVVVAYHHDVAVLLGQKARDLVLRMVGVLILVDHDVAEAQLIGLEHVGMVLQQQVRVQQQVVEIEGVGLLQALLQLLVHARGHLAHRVVGLLGEVTGHLQLVFCRGNTVHQGVYRETLRVDVQLGHDFLIQALLVVGVVDGEALRESQALGVGAQHAHAHAVEGGHPHAAAAWADQALQALAHLGGRLVGERDGQDLPWRHVQILQDVRDAVREHARFA